MGDEWIMGREERGRRKGVGGKEEVKGWKKSYGIV